VLLIYCPSHTALCCLIPNLSRLQPEQVNQKANSPPESRRSNSKASKAPPSSAVGSARGHASRRYRFFLLYCVWVSQVHRVATALSWVLKSFLFPVCYYRNSLSLSVGSHSIPDPDLEAAGTSGQQGRREGSSTRALKRSSASEPNISFSPSPAKRPKAVSSHLLESSSSGPSAPTTSPEVTEPRKAPASVSTKSKKRRALSKKSASYTGPSGASSTPSQKRKKADASSLSSSAAGPLPPRSEASRAAKPTKLASKSAASAKAGCSTVTDSSSSSASSSSSSSSSSSAATGANSCAPQGARLKQGKDQSKARRSRSASSRDKEQSKAASSSKFDWTSRFNSKVNLPKPKLLRPPPSLGPPDCRPN
ncbi:hypothetical protein M9458_037144, partial [Cirrhinus mrigala]